MIAALEAFWSWALAYVGLALLWAGAAGALAAVPLAWLAPRAIPLAFATALTVCLALVPFPDPATFDCATSPARLILRPFDGAGDVLRRLRETGAPWRLLTDRLFVSWLANVAFFMLPGAALALLTSRMAVAAACGLALSAAVEVTQFTGNLGYYDCAYRVTDVTDLATNVLGVVLGFALARRRLRRGTRRVR